MKYFSRSLFFIFILSLFFSCAIQVPPSGGEQDTSAPKVLRSSPENLSTGFSGHEISITFDEYIQLKDVQSQLVVSPPLNKFPDLKVRKKTLHILFEDTLQENSTYSFNFGNAIVDNNEGNPVENFQFVLSTGTVIDTLEVSGMIKNAIDAKPEKAALVMLYKGTDDSLPYKKRPYYFAKSDANGNYVVRNISPGSYKIIGLNDNNADYLYNPTDERIAFSNDLVSSGSTNGSLRLFKAAEELKLVKAYSEEPGKAVCVFNGRADTLQLKWYTDSAKLNLYRHVYSEKNDSLIIWYKNVEADTIQFSVPQLTGTDTITIRLLKRDERGFSKFKPALKITPRISAGNFQDLHRNFELVFNHPIESANLSSIIFLEDSLKLSANMFEFADSVHTKLRYTGQWKQKSTYNLLIPSGQFRDIFSLENDTILIEFRTRQEADYASLTAVVKSTAQGYPAILQLVDDNERIFEEASLKNDSSVTFNFLTPGIYRLKSISDQNSNGRWDSGSYLKGVQPEQVYYYPESIQIRANWDVEIKWQLP